MSKRIAGGGMSLIGKNSTIMLRDKIIEGLDEISYSKNTNPDIMCFQERTATMTVTYKGTNSQLLKLRALLRREYKRKISRKKKKKLRKQKQFYYSIQMNFYNKMVENIARKIELEVG